MLVQVQFRRDGDRRRVLEKQFVDSSVAGEKIDAEWKSIFVWIADSQRLDALALIRCSIEYPVAVVDRPGRHRQ